MARMALSIGFGILGAALAPFTAGTSLAFSAQFGFALGSVVGSVIGSLAFPGKGTHVYGPRVSDMQLSTSAPGSVEPMLWGRMVLGGQIIAGNGLQEVTSTTSQSAKGGPSVTQTNYTYFCTFAAAFCQGVATITRIWGDSKLIYDKTGGTTPYTGVWNNTTAYVPGNVVLDAGTYWLCRNANTNKQPSGLIGILEYWSPTPAPAAPTPGTIAKNINVKPTLYTGSTTQTADPTLVALNGADKTPGYRGTCYAVWNKFPLVDFGNRLPNIRAEVTTVNAAATPEAQIGVDFSETNSPNYAPNYIRTSPDGLVGFVINANGVSLKKPFAARIDMSSNTIVTQGLCDATPINSGFTIDDGYTFNGNGWVVDSNYDIWANCHDGSLLPYLVCFDGWTFKAKHVISSASVRQAMFSAAVDSMNLYHANDGQDYIVMGNGNSTYSGFTSSGYVVAVFQLLPYHTILPSGIPDTVQGLRLAGQYPLIQVDVINPTDTLTQPNVKQFLPVLDQKGNAWFTFQGFHDDSSGHNYTVYDSYIIKINMPGGVSDFVSGGSPCYSDVKRWRINGDSTVGTITNIMYDGDDNTLIAFTDTGTIMKIDASDGAVIQTSAPARFSTTAVAFSINAIVKAQKGTVNNGVFFVPKPGTIAQHSLYAYNASDLSFVGEYNIDNWPNTPSSGTGLVTGSLTVDPVHNSLMLATANFTFPNSTVLGGTFPTRYGVYRFYLDRLSTAGYGCDQIVEAICNLSGIDDANIDVSNIADLSVDGYPVVQIQPGKDIINNLAMMKFFEGRESDFKLQFIKRGQSVLATIPLDELGMAQDKCHMVEMLGQEQDRPKEVEVLFTDPALDYQQNKSHRVRHSRTKKTKNITSISTPIVMSAIEAQQIADKVLWSAEAEARTFKTSSYKASNLLYDPCDVVNLTTEDGLTLTARITMAQLGQNFASVWELTSEDSNNYQSSQAGVTATGYVPQTISGLSPTLWWLLDLPYLTDSDADSTGNTGYYFAGDPLAPGASWRGFALYNSSDNAQYNQQGASVDAIAYGVAQNALAAPASPWRWDETNTLTVKMLNGTAPSSTSDLNVLNGANAAILVPSGEVIQFGTATLNSDGSYTLSHLLRGRRGTELSCGTAVLGEKVLFPLTQGGLHRNQVGQALIGKTRYWKAVTIGSDINSPLPITTVALTGADLKPYAPYAIAGSKGGNDWTLGWIRRTRLGGDWNNGDGTGSVDYNGQSVPLNEDGQAYFVEITDNIGVVKRSGTVTSNRFSYTSAMQVTDFGSNQSTIYVNVYQISAQVGIGFKSTAIITQSKPLPAVDTAPAMANPTATTGRTSDRRDARDPLQSSARE